MEGAVLSGKLAAKEINELSRELKIIEAETEQNAATISMQEIILPDLVTA